ncbi:MAG: phosphatase PAP2 family protein [Saprospiraceae bacterium]|nr:phosphatase PAP2 family protein [Bacteroidia bacterium]NNE16800.1 phosphatase PAP2 family protein [Saprospiraceae bacterium]NNL92867.1 phosphatase PAP2 family protein [Saprospiraceae bacterium]
MAIKKIMQICLFVFLIGISATVLFAQNDSGGWPTTLQHSGDAIQIGLPAGALVYVLLDKDKEGLKEFAYAFGANMIATHTLKHFIHKKRPGNSNAYNAMPSGHTSASFQAATFLYIRKGPKFGIPAYILASYVGYSRIKGVDKRHDYLDVLGGAILGSLTSYIFTTSKDSPVKVIPAINNNSVSLSFHFNFK